MTDHRRQPPRPSDAAVLTLRPDLPSRAGFDSDHPLAKGMAAVDGPALSHLGDLAALLPNGDAGPVEIMSDATGPWMLAMLVALTEIRGVARETLRGALCNDVIADAQSPAAPRWSTAAALDLGADTLSWTRRVLPDLRGARLHVSSQGDPVTAMAMALRSGLALLAASARREKPEHLRAAAQGVEFVMPGDSAQHRAAGATLAALWHDLLVERHGPDFTRRDDLVLYRSDAVAPARIENAISAAELREALERVAREAICHSLADTPPPPAAVPEHRTEALARWRRERDGNAVQKSLLALREAAKRGINIMGPSVACAKAGVTTGEWARVLADALPAAEPLLVHEIPAVTNLGDLDDACASIEQAARGLARPVTVLVVRPGLDARPPAGLPLLRAAQDCGVELRDPGPRRLPADIAAAVSRDRPHVVIFAIHSPQSVEMATESIDALRQAGFGMIPMLCLSGFDCKYATRGEFPKEVHLRAAGEISAQTFLNDLAELVTLRNSGTS